MTRSGELPLTLLLDRLSEMCKHNQLSEDIRSYTASWTKHREPCLLLRIGGFISSSIASPAGCLAAMLVAVPPCSSRPAVAGPGSHALSR